MQFCSIGIFSEVSEKQCVDWQVGLPCTWQRKFELCKIAVTCHVIGLLDIMLYFKKCWWWYCRHLHSFIFTFSFAIRSQTHRTRKGDNWRCIATWGRTFRLSFLALITRPSSRTRSAPAQSANARLSYSNLATSHSVIVRHLGYDRIKWF